MAALIYKTIFSLALITLIAEAGYGQRTVAALQPAHASALEEFLSKNKTHRFRPEHFLDKDYLRDMRKYFRKGFMPYYCYGDFNNDKIDDFAIILSRDGEPKSSGDEINEHNPDFPLTVLVFNGQKKGGFKVAFTEDLYGPNAAFINYEIEKGKKILYYGIFETDSDTFIMRPAGKGYIIDFPEQP